MAPLSVASQIGAILRQALNGNGGAGWAKTLSLGVSAIRSRHLERTGLFGLIGRGARGMQIHTSGSCRYINHRPIVLGGGGG